MKCGRRRRRLWIVKTRESATRGLRLLIPNELALEILSHQLPEGAQLQMVQKALQVCRDRSKESLQKMNSRTPLTPVKTKRFADTERTPKRTPTELKTLWFG